MESENTELALNKRIQASFSNHTWQVDHTVFDSSGGSVLPSRLVLAIVADLYSQTIVGYHMSAEEPSKVAIAALLHALCQKNYPRYSLSALWGSGDSPQVLFIDGSKAFDQALTYFPEIIGTSKVSLQSPVKVSFNHGELRSLLEDYFFQYNRNISP